MQNITVDKTVEHIPQSGQTQERDINQTRQRIILLPRKQNKKIHKTRKKLLQKDQQKVLNFLNER